MLIELDRKKMEEVARRNDIARQLGLNVVLTTRAAKLPDLEELLRSVRTYNDFTEKNDPYKAHDMGFFEWRGERVIWKIDYFNERLEHFKDPLSFDCKRLITIMLAKEY